MPFLASGSFNFATLSKYLCAFFKFSLKYGILYFSSSNIHVFLPFDPSITKLFRIYLDILKIKNDQTKNITAKTIGKYLIPNILLKH